jgi:FkbM family methyltransferase
MDHHADARFFDCGANIGYWAAQYSRRTDLVLAVEPVPDTYARLEATAAANGFIPLRAAVWSRAGERVRVTWDPKRHAGASVVTDQGHNSSHVPTVTLAQLTERFAEGHPVVVKLDVEGSEAEAVRGAEPVLHDLLIIYEDHGSDLTHQATSAALERGLMVTYFNGNSKHSVAGLAHVDRIKARRNIGYNFVAHHPQGRWTDWLRD